MENTENSKTSTIHKWSCLQQMRQKPVVSLLRLATVQSSCRDQLGQSSDNDASTAACRQDTCP